MSNRCAACDDKYRGRMVGAPSTRADGNPLPLRARRAALERLASRLKLHVSVGRTASASPAMNRRECRARRRSQAEAGVVKGTRGRRHAEVSLMRWAEAGTNRCGGQDAAQVPGGCGDGPHLCASTPPDGRASGVYYNHHSPVNVSHRAERAGMRHKYAVDPASIETAPDGGITRYRYDSHGMTPYTGMPPSGAENHDVGRYGQLRYRLFHGHVTRANTDFFFWSAVDSGAPRGRGLNQYRAYDSAGRWCRRKKPQGHETRYEYKPPVT